MDYTKLQHANKLNDKIHDLQRVSEHFEKEVKRADSGQNSSEVLKTAIDDYINRCNNLGTSEIRRELIFVMLTATRIHLKERIDELQKEFEAL